MKPVPVWVAGVMEVLPRLRPAWLCSAACPFATERMDSRKEMRGGPAGAGSEGGDVVECVVQLLADGLVLHLLCVDFIFQVINGFL